MRPFAAENADISEPRASHHATVLMPPEGASGSPACGASLPTAQDTGAKTIRMRRAPVSLRIITRKVGLQFEVPNLGNAAPLQLDPRDQLFLPSPPVGRLGITL
ncbi:MAG: hypothetical protein DRN91_03795 [Candidatus Alkanophagales archaeon]|nr:MAG: hypothetical protein DRN91_03795 [Candidatus Alkanophagales archaeon]